MNKTDNAGLIQPGYASRRAAFAIAAAIMAAWAFPAAAHVSEQGFVLLLPTGLYIGSGVAAIILTVLVLSVLPTRLTERIFVGVRLFRNRMPALDGVASLIFLGLLAVLVFIGFSGPRDPLSNPLPLFIWTIWWMAFLVIQALFGDIWHWVNPWTGFYRVLRGNLETDGLIRLPVRLGCWPGLLAFVAFASYSLADPAPDDPARLAVLVAGYWLYTFAGMMIFGARDWLARGECFTMLLRHFAMVSPLRYGDGGIHAGAPGWQLVHAPALSLSGSLFVLLILGTGSFDGLNETFWWLARIGVNPLEFPGRSAVVMQSTLGLIAANIVLPVLYSGVIVLGLALAGEPGRFSETFGRLTRAILPIAFGYHVAHYLTGFLVNGQYALTAATDPLGSGADYLGLGQFYVTTGFLNSRGSVEVIWLCQAAAVVFGHMLAVLVCHAIAVDMFSSARKAVLSQVPLAAFMIVYTLFGLWLLAAPRGA